MGGSAWDWVKGAAGLAAGAAGGAAVPLALGLYDAVAGDDDGGGGGPGDAILGEKRQYNQYGLEARVGEYGDGPNAYANRYNQLEEERYGYGKQAQNDYLANQVDRGLQQDAARSYQGVLNGTAPSLAQMQMRQGTQAAAMNANNVAAGARGGGGNQILAMQNAQRQNAAAAQDANMGAAMLRAKELDAARGGLAGTAGQMRTASLQSRQQNLQQQQGLMGAQQGMTEHYDAQKMGLAQLNSANFNASQGQQQTQDTARDQRKTETVKQGMDTAGKIAAKGSGA